LNGDDIYDGDNWLEIGLSIFIMSHLFIVIFCSHGNGAIFRLHPFRFTAVPLLVLVVMGFSTWALVIGSVIATFWDVYHSSLQTFGLGRIYDKLAGNDPTVGRRLDITLNFYIYAGPIAAGVPFLVYYILAYWRLARAGHRISYQKVLLLFLTGVCSIYAWGFNPFGMAFFIMNVFHAWQYFALIWWSERKTLTRLVGREGRARAGAAALTLLLGTGLAYGLVAGLYSGDNSWIVSAFLVVSLMHFWYDGFIWSARRNQI
jgi:hypothetical protein